MELNLNYTEIAINDKNTIRGVVEVSYCLGDIAFKVPHENGDLIEFYLPKYQVVYLKKFLEAYLETVEEHGTNDNQLHQRTKGSYL